MQTRFGEQEFGFDTINPCCTSLCAHSLWMLPSAACCHWVLSLHPPLRSSATRCTSARKTKPRMNSTAAAAMAGATAAAGGVSALLETALTAAAAAAGARPFKPRSRSHLTCRNLGQNRCQLRRWFHHRRPPSRRHLGGMVLQSWSWLWSRSVQRTGQLCKQSMQIPGESQQRNNKQI